jgi:hypothetical protein
MKYHEFTIKELLNMQANRAFKNAMETQAFAQGKDPLLTNDLKGAVWSILTTPELGPIGGGVSLISLSGAGLKSLDGLLTHIGGILTVIQFYNDIKSGNKLAQYNAAKGGTFWAIGATNVSVVLKTAAVGVGLIDYSLNKLGTELSNSRYAFWEKAYRRYYDKKYGFRMTTLFDPKTRRRKISDDDTEKWIDLIFNRYNGKIDTALEEGFSDFWNNAETNADSVGMHATKGLVTLVRGLSKKEQESIRKNYLGHVLPAVLNTLKWKRDRALRDAKIELQIAFDKVYENLSKTVNFTGLTVDDKKRSLEGVLVALFNRAPVKTGKNGEYRISLRTCELYDYFSAEHTNKARLNATYTDPSTGIPVRQTRNVDVPIIWGSPNRDQGPNNFVFKRNDLLGIEIDKKNVTLTENTSRGIRVFARYEGGIKKDITGKADWKVDNNTIAHVENGKILATKVGKTKFKAIYDAKGAAIPSQPVQINVLPAKILTGISLSPASLAMQPGETARVSVTATFSDGTNQDVTASADTRWTAQDRSVKLTGKGQIKAVKAMAGNPDHQVTVTYSFFGRDRKSAVLPVRIELPKTYSRFSLSKTQIVMGLNENVGIRAKAIVTQGPFTAPVDVTAKVDWQIGNRQIIKQAYGGVIVSGNRPGTSRITAVWRLKNGKTLKGTCLVKVVDKNAPLPRVDFSISPKKRLYEPGARLTFAAMARLPDRENYELTWFVENVEKNGFELRHVFKKPGSYPVRLVIRSKITGKEDAVVKIVRIRQPPDVKVSIQFSPEQGAYLPGSTIDLISRTENTSRISEYRWYVNGRFLRSGRRISALFSQPGNYEVTLGLRMGSNFDEIKRSRTITIGQPAIGKLGTWRNYFETRGGNRNLSICSRYYKGGIAAWSKRCLIFRRIGTVTGHKLCTGKQSDGYNSGFLIYSDQYGKKLKFEVYHFRFGKYFEGQLHYSGEVQKAANPDPSSLSITCHANAADVSWTNEDGSNCHTRIWKFRTSNMLAHTGMERPVCSKPLVSSSQLRFCNNYAKKSVAQFNENVKRQCGLSGPEWYGDRDAHKRWCLRVPMRSAGRLEKKRQNALRRCGKTTKIFKPWCNAYASRAIAQSQENIRNRCGFTGWRWQASFRDHLNWCSRATRQAASHESVYREQALANCRRNTGLPGTGNNNTATPGTGSSNAGTPGAGSTGFGSGGSSLNSGMTGGSNPPYPPGNAAIRPLLGSWQFGRSQYHFKPVNIHLCTIKLTSRWVPGRGYALKACHANESYWNLTGANLVFYDRNGRASTRFSRTGPNSWQGRFLLAPGDGTVHYLRGHSAPPPAPPTGLNKPGPASVAASYLGCFRDQGDPSGTSGRDLNGYVFNSAGMTTERCISACRSRGFRFAATQYTRWCFCGNSYGRSGRANNCNMRCSGNPAQTCGGSWANSVYRVAR